MDRRKEPRLSIEIPVTFVAQSLEQKGRLTSLSLGGFRIASFPPVPPGASLKLNAHLPDDERPLDIELGTVRWSQDGEFGVSTVILSQESRNRLREFLGTNFQMDAVVLQTRSAPDDELLRHEILDVPTRQDQADASFVDPVHNPVPAVNRRHRGQQRLLKRVRVGFPIRLVGDLTNKKGIVVDLSLGGCGIQNHEGLRDAKYLGLMLCPPGSNDPINIELAAVRWVGDQQAGLEFLQMSPDQRQRLYTLIKGLELAPGPHAA